VINNAVDTPPQRSFFVLSYRPVECGAGISRKAVYAILNNKEVWVEGHGNLLDGRPEGVVAGSGGTSVERDGEGVWIKGFVRWRG
jgi:hypothetical protein